MVVIMKLLLIGLVLLLLTLVVESRAFVPKRYTTAIISKEEGWNNHREIKRDFRRNKTSSTSSSTSSSSWSTSSSLQIRGGSSGGGDGSSNLIVKAMNSLQSYMMKGSKTDILLLLLTTAINTPLCTSILSISPILGFLLLGLIMGPKGFHLIQDIHTTEQLADIGIVFFLFEMGIHLSPSTLWKLRRNVFGLGGLQFIFTSLILGFIAIYAFGQSISAGIILGCGLALSSSAFVLQLLKDTNELETEYGQKSFSILLLQDLMVVPLLVITPILAGGSAGDGNNNNKSLTSALSLAGIQLILALTIIALLGTFILPSAINFVIQSSSQEAIIGLCTSIILGMSFLTEGLGLSNTLGAFLAGVLLSESNYRQTIEKEVSPIRGILVGLFFFTVGFEIDLSLIINQFPTIFLLVSSIILIKTILITILAQTWFDTNSLISRRLGLILCQGGEFAFVAFRSARSYGILDDTVTNMMLTVVSLTMAITPFLEGIGAKMANKQQSSSSSSLKQKKS